MVSEWFNFKEFFKCQKSNDFIHLSLVFVLFTIVFVSSVRRFGFPNIEALNNGLNGTDCRGEEHEVTVVWSITSGKKLVLCDGQEVHSSTNRSSSFDYSWSMKGNHVLKISAHANAPMNPPQGYHQYDLFVDGQSYFIMPKVRKQYFNIYT